MGGGQQSPILRQHSLWMVPYPLTSWHYSALHWDTSAWGYFSNMDCPTWKHYGTSMFQQGNILAPWTILHSMGTIQRIYFFVMTWQKKVGFLAKHLVSQSSFILMDANTVRMQKLRFQPLIDSFVYASCCNVDFSSWRLHSKLSMK